MHRSSLDKWPRMSTCPDGERGSADGDSNAVVEVGSFSVLEYFDSGRLFGHLLWPFVVISSPTRLCCSGNGSHRRSAPPDTSFLFERRPCWRGRSSAPSARTRLHERSLFLCQFKRSKLPQKRPRSHHVLDFFRARCADFNIASPIIQCKKTVEWGSSE